MVVFRISLLWSLLIFTWRCSSLALSSSPRSYTPRVILDAYPEKGKNCSGRNSMDAEMSQIDLRRQETAGAIAAAFVPSEFRPWSWTANCHVQTIGGFFLRDTVAAYLPNRQRNSSPLKRIWQGIQEKMQETTIYKNKNALGGGGGAGGSASSFWDIRERIVTACGQDWFHADTKYFDVREAAAGGGSNNVDEDNIRHPNLLRNAKNRINNHVILLHGLESNSNSTLSRQIAQACHDYAGVNIVTCLNFRSCSMNEKGDKIPNLTPGGYHLGFTDDLIHYLKLLACQKRHENIYLVGFSLGANVVLKALGDLGPRAVDDFRIRGAAVACAPLDLEKNARALARPGINRLVYTDNLLQTMKAKALDQWYKFGNPEDMDDDQAAVIKAAIREYEKGPVAKTADWGLSIVSRTKDSLANDSQFAKQIELTRQSWFELDDYWKRIRPEGFFQETTTRIPAPRKESQAGKIRESAAITAQWARSFVMADFGQLQRGVEPSTILAASAVVACASLWIASAPLESMAATGAVAALLAIQRGPTGAAVRLAGHLGAASFLAAREALRQALINHEATNKPLPEPKQQRDSQAFRRTNTTSITAAKRQLFDLPRVLAATTIAEFDDAFIAPIYGYDDCWDYYRKASASDVLEQIMVPTLVINAQDDPFFDPTGNSPLSKTIEGGGRAPVKLVRTKAGGHLGFCFHEVEDIEELDFEKSSSSSHNKGKGGSWMPTGLARFLKHLQEQR